MTNPKTEALEILQSIPDEKIFPVLEILTKLHNLYTRDTDISEYNETPSSIMGICKKYANPKLIPMEKNAWVMAINNKHDIS